MSKTPRRSFARARMEDTEEHPLLSFARLLVDLAADAEERPDGLAALILTENTDPLSSKVGLRTVYLLDDVRRSVGIRLWKHFYRITHRKEQRGLFVCLAVENIERYYRTKDRRDLDEAIDWALLHRIDKHPDRSVHDLYDKVHAALEEPPPAPTHSQAVHAVANAVLLSEETVDSLWKRCIEERLGRRGHSRREWKELTEQFLKERDEPEMSPAPESDEETE
jgi:hypothetical protein